MLYRNLTPLRHVRRAPNFINRRLRRFCLTALLLAVCVCVGVGQSLERELNASGEIVVKNDSGRVIIVAAAIDEERRMISLRAEAPGDGSTPLSEQDVTVKASDGTIEIEVPASPRGNGRGSRRIDLTLRVPARSKVRVATGAGAVDVSGAVREASVLTDTGTIRIDVPTNALKYSFRWTASRPRYVSELALGEVKERRGGRFEIAGRLGDKESGREDRVRLNLETARGVVLFGVDPATVPSDLRERKLTDAARAIIRSGNEDLIEAIRTIAPKFVGEYAATLPPRLAAPSLAAFQRPTSPATAAATTTAAGAQLVRVNASVTDLNGRAIKGLTAADFDVYENGEQRPIGEVSPANTPFNLVLLLDVSGSVEERLDFVRKAALDFIRTVSPQDRIAIISFRDDVQLISDFTTDRQQLIERVKDIEAGGGTAVYDALAYTLVHTLSPLRGERTAVVLISDGDDNRSFVSFAAVLEATIESGALVYPLYLPSGMIPAGSTPALAAGDAAQSLDPTRTRYLSLTSRAAVEGRKLAETSGGVFYPITRFDELQRAYDDVVAQLRTAYTISYTSNAPGAAAAERRVRVRLARRQDAAIRLSPVVGAIPTAIVP